MSPRITHVLFDLDGTLADTAADLGAALNIVRHEEGLPPLQLEHIRPAVSRGAGGMIRLGFGTGADDPRFGARRERLLDHYRRSLSEHTVLFPGMDQLLRELEDGGYIWGVVTNKSAEFTEPLLRDLGLLDRAGCVVAGDIVEEPKPHPGALLRACALLRCEPARAVYVGDAERDIEAGRRAGMPAVIAAYGYLDDGDVIEEWKADGIIRNPLELLDWLSRSA